MPSIWKRRAAIICQNRFKVGTDIELLFNLIEPSLGRREFFLRKGIGWALRDLAHTDPDVVERYLASKGPELSGLSRREALRGIESERAKRIRKAAP